MGVDLNFSTSNTLNRSAFVFEKENQVLISEIEKEALDNPSPQSEDYKNRAKRSHDMSTLIGVMIEKWLKIKKGNVINAPDSLHNIIELTERYRDLVIMLTDNQEEMQAYLPSLVLADSVSRPNWIKEFWPSANTKKKHLILLNLLNRVKLCEQICLRYCKSKVVSNIGCGWGPTIGISAKNPAPRVGEWYDAEMFLSAYVSKHLNYEFRINGKRVEAKDGIGNFRLHYNTPGEKIFTAEILTRNPVTNEVFSYNKKTFALTVVDTCR